MATAVNDSYTAASGATVYGGRSGVPSWVPSTTWQWTQISGTTWNATINSTSQTSQTGDPVGSSYDVQWAYGGVAYSPKNHEMWLFGGGHDGTTINALTKWQLGSSSPSVSMVCAATAVATRLSDWNAGSASYTATGYHTGGKPKSPHAYANNHYFDDIDEFVSFGIAAIDEPGGASFATFDVAGFPRSGSAWRAENYWSDTDTTVGTYGVQNQLVFESYDRSALYYSRKYTPLFKYTSAGVKTTVGPDITGPVCYTMKGAAESASRALIGGGIENSGSTGWRLWTLNLSTGAETAVTVSGAAWPTDQTNYQYLGIVWSDQAQRYYALLASLNAAPTGANIDGLKLAEIQLTSSSAATATIKTLTGTPPVRFDLISVAVHIDAAYGVLLFAASPGETLFTIKVG